jgi:nitroreductase
LREPKPDAPAVSSSPGREITADIRDYLLQAALRAPSGDNCQPWRFAVQGNTIRLLLDPAADDSFFNVAQLASWISCGAAAENLALAAGRCGLSSQVSMGTSARAGLDITLIPTAADEDPLQRFVWERHTNRTLYDARPLEPAARRQIEAAATPHGARLLLLTDREPIREAARLVSAADTIRSSHRELHEHLMRMIRFTSQEALAKRDGFPLKNLEAGAAGEWLLRHTRPWPVMAALNRLGLGKMIAKISYQGICSASAVGILKIQGGLPADFARGGRALERVWLTAARLGLDFQPMTAITLFRLRWRLNGPADFSPAHRRLLAGLWPRYDRLFEVEEDESHIMLFRLGHGRPVACRTLRKPLSHFISPAADRLPPLPIASKDAPDAPPLIRIAS